MNPNEAQYIILADRNSDLTEYLFTQGITGTHPATTVLNYACDRASVGHAMNLDDIEKFRKEFQSALGTIEGAEGEASTLAEELASTL